MKKILQKILRYLAKRVIKKYQPIIIGITGSVGKSSAKEAVYTVLKNYFDLRRSLKNYNNEVGLPLTILGRLSPGKSLNGWLRVFWLALGSLWFFEKSYPKILLLEMAADRPGDIKYLTEIAPCKIGVVTAVAPVHLEFFNDNLENVAREKSMIVSHLPKNGWAVLNADDERILAMKEKTEARILTYGFSEKVEIRAIEPFIDQEIDSSGRTIIRGINFKVKYAGNTVPFFLSGILAKSQIYAALVGVAIGLLFDLNLIEISEALKGYQALPGRMNLIEGIKESLIIDDTYNSSPKAVEAALEVIKEIRIDSRSKKWIVLGGMLELGKISQEAHQEVGRMVGEMNFDYLVTVGEKAKIIGQAAKETGMPEKNVFHFNRSEEAGKFLAEKIKKNDLILVKGSQGVRMEKTVKQIMANPGKAKKLLVRQDEGWL